MSRAAWISAAALAALLVASGVVAATTPSNAEWERPFAVPASIDERTVGRNIAATVHGAVLSDEVSSSSWTSGEGSLWVLVDASVEAVVTEESTLLGHAVLIIGDRTYAASDRPGGSSLRRAGLAVGIPLRGMLAFELPAGTLDVEAATRIELQLAVDSDPRLDSMIVVPLDLTALPHHRAAQLVDPAWGRG